MGISIPRIWGILFHPVPELPMVFSPLSTAPICLCGLGDLFHTCFLPPPDRGGKESPGEMNSFPPRCFPWKSFPWHRSQQVGVGGAHAAAALWTLLPHFLENPLKSFHKYFLGRLWEGASCCCPHEFLQGKFQVGRVGMGQIKREEGT